MESDNKVIKFSSNKSLKTITIVALSVIVILFVIQWICIYNNISEIKLSQENLAKDKKEVSTFYFNFKNTKNKQILLSPEEFKRMYEHVNGLADIVSKESQRTQDIINQDINRLNLYMAIGIGFISILGIFVPLFVNVLSFDDIKNKQKEQDIKHIELEAKEIELSQKYHTLIEKIDKIPLDKLDSAIEKTKDIDIVVSKVQEIEKTIDDSISKVSTLILQQAITRYFTVVPYLQINYEMERFISIIESIKLGFNECEGNANHSIINNEPLKTLLSDFAYEINSGRSLTIALNAQITNIYIKLSKALKEHIKVTSTEQEVKSNKIIIEVIDELIDSIKKYYAKNKSTAQTN